MNRAEEYSAAKAVCLILAGRMRELNAKESKLIEAEFLQAVWAGATDPVPSLRPSSLASLPGGRIVPVDLYLDMWGLGGTVEGPRSDASPL